MRKNLKFFFCGLFALILTHQPCLAEEKILYKTQGFLKIAKFLEKGPSVANLAALTAFSSGNSDNFQVILDFAKSAKLDPEKTRIYAKVSGNEIRLEGLKDPLVIGNEPKLQGYYRKRKIPWSEGKSLLENLKSIETFFQQSNTTAQATPFSPGAGSLLLQAWLPEAQANPPAFAALILFVLILNANHDIPFDNIEMIEMADWPFLENKISQLNAQCEGKELVIRSGGNEEFSFGFGKAIEVKKKVAGRWQVLDDRSTDKKSAFLQKWAASMIGEEGRKSPCITGMTEFRKNLRLERLKSYAFNLREAVRMFKNENPEVPVTIKDASDHATGSP